MHYRSQTNNPPARPPPPKQILNIDSVHCWKLLELRNIVTEKNIWEKKINFSSIFMPRLALAALVTSTTHSLRGMRR